MSDIPLLVVIPGYAAIGFVTVSVMVACDIDHDELTVGAFLFWPAAWVLALFAFCHFSAKWIGIKIRQAVLNARRKP